MCLPKGMVLKSCEQIFSLHVCVSCQHADNHCPFTVQHSELCLDHHSDFQKHCILQKFCEIPSPKGKFSETLPEDRILSYLGSCYSPQLRTNVPHSFQSHHFNNLIEEALCTLALRLLCVGF